MSNNLDPVDKKILAALQRDATISLVQVSESVGLTSTACWRRIKKLEDKGIIAARVTLLDAKELGLGLCGYVMIRTSNHGHEWIDRFLETVLGLPAVVELHRTTGNVDYLLKIGMANVAAHSRSLAAQLIEGLAGLPEATVLGRSVRDRIALATVSMPWPAMRQQDVARLLADAHAIFVSGGFHCAHVLHHRLKLDGTLRASAHIYNDSGDIEAFIRALHDL